MKSESRNLSQVKSVKTPSPQALIYGDILNVTWRMLAATLIGLAIGYGVDLLLDSSPIGFLVGSGVGLLLGVAAALRLLKVVKEPK